MLQQYRTFLKDALFVIPFAETEAEQISQPSTDVWLFTDPLAKATCAQRGMLRELEQDICTFAMFQGRWGADELEFKRKIDELCDAELVSPEIGFGNISPHPTLYKALGPGNIEICGEKYHFKIGDKIVFASWSERLSHPGICGPLRIGRFDTSDNICLCGQAYPQLTGLTQRDFEVLHQIACYPNHRSM
jgi:hypothetical protein